MPPEAVINNTSLFIDDASLFQFGVLSSGIHMAWVSHVRRLKSDYRYSNKLVYNNYPWPESTTSYQRAFIDAKCKRCGRAGGRF